MKFPCQLSRAGGQWTLRYQGADLGTVEARADSRDEAIAKMEGELRYRLELCPCTGESYQHIAVEIVE